MPSRKKQNVLGQLSLLDPNWQMKNILSWLAQGNYHLLTSPDIRRLESLYDRVTDEDLKAWANDVLATNS